MAGSTLNKQVALKFNRDVLLLDAPVEVARILDMIRDAVTSKLHRKGVVLGLSGGIDLSVVLALCVQAFGAGRVFGVLLPERESSPESVDLAHLLAEKFEVETVTEDITAAA